MRFFPDAGKNKDPDRSANNSQAVNAASGGSGSFKPPSFRFNCAIILIRSGRAKPSSNEDGRSFLPQNRRKRLAPAFRRPIAAKTRFLVSDYNTLYNTVQAVVFNKKLMIFLRLRPGLPGKNPSFPGLSALSSRHGPGLGRERIPLPPPLDAAALPSVFVINPYIFLIDYFYFSPFFQHFFRSLFSPFPLLQPPERPFFPPPSGLSPALCE